MQIINNNNGSDMYHVDETGRQVADKNKAEQKTDSFAGFNVLALIGNNTRRRTSFVQLAYYFGWLGLHYFYVGKTVAGVLQAILSLIGIGSCMTLLVLNPLVPLDLPDHACKVLLYAICTFPVSLFIAVLTAMLWSCKDDKDFENTYYHINTSNKN